jgi:antitoxin VapB
MPLNIKNREVERLAAEVADLAGETKTEAVRRALAERRDRLAYRISGTNRGARLRRFLELEVWPAATQERARTPTHPTSGRGHSGLWQGGCMILRALRAFFGFFVNLTSEDSVSRDAAVICRCRKLGEEGVPPTRASL